MPHELPQSELKDGSPDRRTFLQGVTGAAFGYWVAGASAAKAGSASPNERLGIGFVGTGSRSRAHQDIILKLKEQGLAEPVAVCDVYRPRLDDAAQHLGDVKKYDQHEALLDDPNVDVVCIATPDRHHAPQAIDAMNAGKDVYCEKPLTHWSQFDLAKKVDAVAKATGRLVQVGTQHMADDNYPQIINLIHDGAIGKPVHVECSYFRRGDWGERMQIPDAHATPGPNLNWERFLGDAPQAPFSVSRFFQWRMYWDYAGGPATDLLVHTFTPVFCLLELDYPERVMGGGGTFEFDREVPDQCNIIADYKDGPTVVMTNSLSNQVPADTIIRGTKGVIIWSMLQGGSDKYGGVRIVPSDKNKKEVLIPWKGQGDTSKLWLDLLDCVKTRDKPKCNIDMAVRVQAPLSMGVIAHRESRVVKFDPATQALV